LSGTPVENHLGELWSLLTSSTRNARSYAAFKKRFGNERTPDSGSINFLRRTLRPFILRRKKEEVTPDLPEKIEETILCEMEAEQKQVYQEVKDRCRNSVLPRSRQGHGEVQAPHSRGPSPLEAGRVPPRIDLGG